MKIAVPELAISALAQFPQIFTGSEEYTSPPGAAWAPGRVNLIGEHTDYNDGFVLPIAVDRVSAFAGRARSDDTIRLWSTHFQSFAHFSLAELPQSFEQQREQLADWARYVLGVVSELRKKGVELSGFDAVIDGNVPLGGGMSSSAALEVATAYACALFSAEKFSIGKSRATLTPMQVAEACQHAEQIASGVQCGILDQAASCLGQPEKAVLLDCRSLDYRYLPFHAPGLSLLVIDTGVRRELASSAYNERRKQCEEAARLLRDLILKHEAHNEQARTIIALRDISQEQLARYAAELPPVLRKRAEYVIAENARVLKTVKLLDADAFKDIGDLLWQSHAGLRDEYEVSCEELDSLVDIAHHVPGVLGARMLGGGFGGCTINLVHDSAVLDLQQAVEQHYPAQTGRIAPIAHCRASGGPGFAWAS